MIMIPISVGWFIVTVVVTAIALYALAARASYNSERRKIAEGKLEIIVGKGILHHRQEIHDERHRTLCKREEAVSEAVSEEEARLHRLKHDLGQAAHDMAVQTNLAIHQTMDDTVIIIPELET